MGLSDKVSQRDLNKKKESPTVMVGGTTSSVFLVVVGTKRTKRVGGIGEVWFRSTKTEFCKCLCICIFVGCCRRIDLRDEGENVWMLSKR